MPRGRKMFLRDDNLLRRMIEHEPAAATAAVVDVASCRQSRRSLARLFVKMTEKNI